MKKLTLMGIFTALGVSLAFAFTNIPNVEMVTAIIFISGYMMGIREGLINGIITEGIYSAFNPYGMAALPIFIAQILAMGFAGIMGGIWRKYSPKKTRTFYIGLALTGLFLTIVFGLLTTVAFLMMTKITIEMLIGSLFYGLGFYIIHMISNTLIFFTIVPVLINVLGKTDLINRVAVPGDL